MSRLTKLRSVRGGAGARKPTLEWIGGRLPTAIGIQDEGRRFYAELVLWAEVETGLVLGTRLAEPGRDPAVLRTLFLSVLERPAAGPPRLPDRIRVRTNEDAATIALALPPGVTLCVGDVPELNEILADFERSMHSRENEASYFDDGLSESALARLFAAAKGLYRAAPWKAGYDGELLRIDIPEVGLNGLCVSLLGANDEVFGFSLFDSIDDYDDFIDASSEMEPGSSIRPRDFGAGWRLMSFDRGAELSKKMRREVRDHAWPIAGAKAYPTFSAHERNGMPRAVHDDDLLVLAVVADALTVFAATHPLAFCDLAESTLEDEGIIMEHHGTGLPPCMVTFPYDPADWAASRHWAGGNDGDSDHEVQDPAAYIRDYKTKHYASWPDVPLPALGGRTPRRACRTKAGRRAVADLLREMELHESELPDSRRYDFGVLRGLLGM